MFDDYDDIMDTGGDSPADILVDHITEELGASTKNAERVLHDVAALRDMIRCKDDSLHQCIDYADSFTKVLAERDKEIAALQRTNDYLVAENASLHEEVGTHKLNAKEWIDFIATESSALDLTQALMTRMWRNLSGGMME